MCFNLEIDDSEEERKEKTAGCQCFTFGNEKRKNRRYASPRKRKKKNENVEPFFFFKKNEKEKWKMCIHMERIFLRKELRNENGGSVYILIQTSWNRKEKCKIKNFRLQIFS